MSGNQTYTLVIAEKPDAARKIASALGSYGQRKMFGVEYFDIPECFDKKHYVVCAASGHLYGLVDTSNSRSIYPVFDVEWFPSNLIFSSGKNSMAGKKKYLNTRYQASRLHLISELAKHAYSYVHACDYDLEGETIGYNIIKYASSGGKPVLRAKFSTLTEDEIRVSFSKAKEMTPEIAEAGRARHKIDFFWGVNLSRALTQSSKKASGTYHNLTIGRVQGPTLAFLVERESEINSHVPIPYWTISIKLIKQEKEFDAVYEKERIQTEKEARDIYSEIAEHRFATVNSITSNSADERSPFPFNLGDLQREAFRLFKLSPSATVAISEKLYLAALISYPRTDSQKLPPSIGYSKIISKLLSQSEYCLFSESLREGKRRQYPIQGFKEDPAHPAIYPTGVTPKGEAQGMYGKVYDLIVRRFLAAFSEDAKIKSLKAIFDVGGYHFISTDKIVTSPGWMNIYPFYSGSSALLPQFVVGEEVKLVNSAMSERFTESPQRYSEGSLLQKMEKEQIGTKATRAETISTLIDRGYVTHTSKRTLIPTDIGLSLIDTMQSYCGMIVSTDLTRSTEEGISEVSMSRSGPEELVSKTMREVILAIEAIRSRETEIGKSLGSSLSSESSKRKASLSIQRDTVIGSCPKCGTGKLRIIKSPKTHKRFIGCTNYAKGCKNSSPLPQRGAIRQTGRECPECRWPILTLSFRRAVGKPWTICSNIACPNKSVEKAVQS
ncbi:MAG: DNA topoisomerase I [Nitrososphaerales archaeon]